MAPIFTHLFRGLAVVLLMPLAVVCAVLVLLLFPPETLLRRALVPLARDLLGTQAIDVGELTWRPLHTIAAEDIYLGASPPLAMPLLTLKELRLRYNVRQLHRRAITIEEVLLRQPTVWGVIEDGQASWTHLLPVPTDQAPSTKTAPPHPTTEKRTAATSRPPPKIAVALKQLHIDDVTVFLSQPGQRLFLRGLNVEAAGAYDAGKHEGHLRVHWPRPDNMMANLAVENSAVDTMQARLALALDFRTEIQGNQGPAARTDLALTLVPLETRAPWPLAAPTVHATLQGHANLLEDRAALTTVALSLDDETIVSASAVVEGLLSRIGLDVTVDRLALPLKKLQPYLALALGPIELDGSIAGEAIHARATLADLRRSRFPLLRGVIHARDIYLRTGPSQATAAPLARMLTLPDIPPLRLAGLNATLSFGAGAEPPASDSPPSLDDILRQRLRQFSSGGDDAVVLFEDSGKPTRQVSLLLALGRISLGELDVAGAEIRGLRTRFGISARPHGLALGPLAATMAFHSGTVSYRDPTLGMLRTHATVDLAITGDLDRQDIDHAHLTLAAHDLLTVDLRARAKRLGEEAFYAEIKVAPLDLKQLLAALPPPLRAQLPLAELRGTASLAGSVRGKIPPPAQRALTWQKWPLSVDLSAGLRGVTIEALHAPSDANAPPAFLLSASGIEGDLSARGKLPRLNVAGTLGVRRLAERTQGIVVSQLKTDLALSLSPHRLRLELHPRIALLGQRSGSDRIAISDVALDSVSELELNLPRLLQGRAVPLRRAESTVAVTLSSVEQTRAGQTLRLGQVATQFSLNHNAAARSPLSLRISGSLEELSQPQTQRVLRGVRWQIDPVVTAGVTLALPQSELHLAQLATRIEMLASVAAVETGGALLMPLADNQLSLSAELAAGGRLRLKALDIRAPTLGGHLSVTADVDDLWTWPRTDLPRFAIHVDGLIHPSAASSTPEPVELVAGLRLSGSAGLKARLHRADQHRVAINGELRAQSLTLWHELIAPVPAEQRLRIQRVHLQDLYASVPFAQTLPLRSPAFVVEIPPPERSIFAAGQRGVLYDALRPYSARRANVTLAALRIEDELRGDSDLTTGPLSRQRIDLGPLVLDMALADSTLFIDRMALDLFGGNLVGALRLQLPTVQGDDVHLALRTQATQIDLAQLDPRGTLGKKDTRVSALVELDYRTAQRDLSGRAQITDISLTVLDALLGALDPHGENASVAANRQLLSAWYTRFLRPKVREVSVWISHSALNMDIRLQALEPFGALLRRILRDVRIRRLSIRHFLP